MGAIFSLVKGKGRLNLNLSAEKIGPDWLIILTGGAEHIGAAALAGPDEPGRSREVHGHREGELAFQLAETLAKGLGARVAVICGIHYDKATAAEIAEAVGMAHELAQSALRLMENDHDQHSAAR